MLLLRANTFGTKAFNHWALSLLSKYSIDSSKGDIVFIRSNITHLMPVLSGANTHEAVITSPAKKSSNALVHQRL